MDKELMYAEDEYKIFRHRGIPDEAVVFLDETSWGTEGAVYEHKNTEEKIEHLHNPTLMTLDKGGKMVGTAAFCNVPVTVGDKHYNCYFVRYFASSPSIRGKGVISKYGSKLMELIHEGETRKTIFYASVEKGNKASYKAAQNSGYDRIGTVSTNGFSRFFPRKSEHTERVTMGAEQEEVIGLMQEQYKEHALVHFNSLFLHDDYYVIRENGEIVAGCQVHRALWVIDSMPGLMGKILLHVVPRIPVLNQLFNPKRFEFLAFDGIYVKPGYEERLSELFEGLLAMNDLKSALYWMSSICPVRKRILENIKPGLIHSFVKDSDVYIMASFNGLDKREIEDIKSRPFYASGFDYI